MTAFASGAVNGGDPGAFYAGPCVTFGVADDQGADAVLHDPNAIVPRNVFGQEGWFCTSPVAEADVRSHGFLPMVSFACGTTVHA
ncbi:hypothetical protein ACWGKU_27155 [Kitasatospora sp. NPDC054768]